VPAAHVVQHSIWRRLAWLKLALFWRTRRPDAELELPELAQTLGRVFSLRSPILCAVLMVLANLAGGVLTVVAPVLFMQHLGWSQSEYSDLAGGPGLLIGLLGSFAAGFLADKLGHRRLVAIALAAMGLEWLAFAFGQAWWNDRAFVYSLFFI